MHVVIEFVVLQLLVVVCVLASLETGARCPNYVSGSWHVQSCLAWSILSSTTRFVIIVVKICKIQRLFQ